MENESRLSSLDTLLLNVVRYGLFAVLLLPFVVVMSYLYPWVSGKIWGLLIIVELLFPLYVLLAFRRKEYRPDTNPFLYALLGWFVVITLSALFGADLHRSMWSKPDRLTGLFFQYHLLAFFLMAGSVWRTILKRPIVLTVLSATLMAMIGMYQAFVTSEDGRGQGRLGNPSYLGQYLVPHVFLAAWLWWKDRASMLRILWSVAAIFLLLGIYATKSKGALLGLFIGLVVASCIAAWRGTGRVKFWARIGMVALAGAVGLFLLLNKIDSTKAWLYENRLAIQYYQETSGSRKLLVDNAINTFKDRPLLGWGPENFESGYYYHYDPETIRYSDYETRQDRPHNLVLELLANFGVIGVLAYAVLLFFAVRMALRDPARRVEGGILAVALISQVAVNLFIFETPISYVMFFAQLAFLAAFISPKVEDGEDDLKQGSIPAFVIVGAVAIWAMSYGVLGTMRAARHTAALIIASGRPESVEEAKFLEIADQLLATKTPYLERDTRAVISNVSAARGDVRRDKVASTLKKLADTQIPRLEHRKGDFVFNLVATSSFMSIANRSAEEEAALQSTLGRIKELAPNRQEVYWYEGAYLESKGDLAGAEAAYRYAIDLYPDALVSKGNLAAFYMLNKRPADAVALLKADWNAISVHREGSGPINGALYRLLSENRNAEVIALFHAAEQQEIGTFEWYMAGVLATSATGDEAEATRIAEKAKTLWPDKTDLIDQVLTQIRDEIKAKKAAADSAPKGPVVQP